MMTRALRGRRLLILAVIVLLVSCGSGKSKTSPKTSRRLRAVDVAQQAGIAQTSRTHGENCVADFNGDGRTDLLLSTHEQLPWNLYLGKGDGRFVQDHDVTFARRDRHGCAVADFNRDGLLDVYFSIGACRGTCKNAKELWIQQPNHTFVDEAAKWGITDAEGRGREPVVLNANRDKLPDLYTGQEKAVKFPSLSRLWINRGDHFEQPKSDPTINGLGNLCTAAADINGDGLDELAFCSGTHGFLLYRNTGGHFVEDTSGFGLANYGRITVKFADLNKDGRPDLVTVTRTGMQVFLNKDGRFAAKADFTQKLADGKDAAVGDIDGDGDLDIYVQQRDKKTGHDMTLLNGGDGTTFTRGPVPPSPSRGGGDTVIAIPKWKGTKRAAFVVNNGFQNDQGPRQLIEFKEK